MNNDEIVFEIVDAIPRRGRRGKGGGKWQHFIASLPIGQIVRIEGGRGTANAIPNAAESIPVAVNVAVRDGYTYVERRS